MLKVLKFGGSSVGSAEMILKVKKIVEAENNKCIVVVSAIKGVTDQLLKLSNMAVKRNEIYKNELEDLINNHINILRNTINDENKREVTIIKVKNIFSDLENILYGVFLLKEFSKKTLDYILSFGERLSATILSQVIENAEYIDAREIIKTDNNFGNAKVDFGKTNELIIKKFEKINKIPVVTGFIASSQHEETTTLGRGGSDYTAAIIAAALNASICEIWTDVDGFMTADPRKVEKAYPIEHLSYIEAMELSHFGAKVVYTPTIQPLFSKNIPVHIKNTFNTKAQGTIISKTPHDAKISPIVGVSSIDEIDLLTLQGAGMVGVMGISMRLFSCLARNSVNIILITQASSEYSITFAINPKDTENAKNAILKEFANEIELRKILSLNIDTNLSIIAIVGEGMKNTPGISAKLFSSLGRNGVNVIAIAQGSSEYNISIVVDKKSLAKGLNAIHEEFFLSQYREINLYLVGLGTVGSSLCGQIQKQQKVLLEQHRLKINMIGIANIDKMLIDKKGIDLKKWKQDIDEKGENINLEKFTDTIKNLNLRNSIFIDCTASADVAALYKKLLSSYISVVAANKIAASSEYKNYAELKQLAKDKNVKFYYETNVGAGLPLISTINDLVKSGDNIIKIEAVLSGTLNFIFNVISEKVPMSEAIKLAKEKGYSEPDPRIDLSGTDVVRKLIILAREAGYVIEKEDVIINRFLPDECFKGDIENFWNTVKKYDSDFEVKRKQLEKENKRWRFIGEIYQGKAKCELTVIDSNHPAYNLEGSNNIVLITTERYKELPMVIKGYGAGAEVTAAGVFADIFRIANI